MEQCKRVATCLASPKTWCRKLRIWFPVYANSGIARRYQVIGGPVVNDILNGTRSSGSPFLPTEANESIGPTTGERLRIYAEEAGPMALRAASAALAESQFEPDSISHLVTVSCTGFVAPGVDRSLIRGLNLRPTVERTHIGFMGCHAALNGLRVANAFTTANPAARVLLCAVELCSLHYYYGSEADKLVANAIFADGAAAIVGSASVPLIPGGTLLSAGAVVLPDWSVAASGSWFFSGKSRRPRRSPMPRRSRRARR